MKRTICSIGRTVEFLPEGGELACPDLAVKGLEPWHDDLESSIILLAIEVAYDILHVSSAQPLI